MNSMRPGPPLTPAGREGHEPDPSGRRRTTAPAPLHRDRLGDLDRLDLRGQSAVLTEGGSHRRFRRVLGLGVKSSENP